MNKINNNNYNNQKENNVIIKRPENSQISSMNSSTKKEYDSSNNPNNFKKQATYKKPLSHSNSTKEIYSNNNMEKYLKIKQSQIIAQKKISKNQNIYRQKKSSMGNNNNNSKYNRIPSSSKGNGTSININNYYTNNIFSAIYNNFLPHQNIEKKNEGEKNYKKSTQRASSVFYQKRPISKNKNEIDNNRINNKFIYRK